MTGTARVFESLSPSLSTMWAIGRVKTAEELGIAAQALGFASVEINYQVSAEFLRLATDAVDSGHLRVSSVHDPCPAPLQRNRAGHVPQLSALDKEERAAAVELACGTLEVAGRLGAKAVVIHAGRVDVDEALWHRLRDLYPARDEQPEEYHRALRELHHQRTERQAAHLAATRRSLEAIADRARALRLKVGLENRYHYYEVPNPNEMAALLDALDPDVVGYWHDTGHAQVLENLGFVPQTAWLERFAARLIGLHLHDVQGLHDHLAARGRGVDFGAIRSLIPDGPLRVCEFSPQTRPDEVRASLAYLKKTGYF